MGVQNVDIQGLEHNPHWTVQQRRKAEWQWIKKLGTRFPKGLNERLEDKRFDTKKK